MFTFGSLFSGIGGIDLGLERAEMVCRWQVEIDPFCRKVLNKHWPNVPKYEDVRNVGNHNLEPVDLIAGGFPCQPHSFAGKRRGAEDDRNLWPEYRRIVGELNPTWVVGENVPGIKTTILDDVLSDLEGLNYQTRTLVIPACALGAPHIRERVFILAHSNSVGRQRPATWQSAFDQKWNDTACQPAREAKFHAIIPGREDMVHTQDDGLSFPRKTWEGGAGFENSGESMCNTISAGLAQWQGKRTDTQQEQSSAVRAGGQRGGWWEVEPGVGRVANGIPNRVDRLRGLGNAVVPQVAEWIGSLIMVIARGDSNSSPVFNPHVTPFSNFM